jgi:hypothetical protein
MFIHQSIQVDLNLTLVAVLEMVMNNTELILSYTVPIA